MTSKVGFIFNLLILLCLSAGKLYATPPVIDAFHIKIDVFENDSVKVEAVIDLYILDNSTISIVDIPLIPYSSSRSLVNFHAESKGLEAMLINSSEYRYILRIIVPNGVSGKTSIEYSYFTDAYVFIFKKRLSVYPQRYFSFWFYMPNVTVKDVDIEVKLPRSYDIDMLDPYLPIYEPEPDVNRIDIWTGRRVIIWRLNENRSACFSLSYRGGKMNKTPIYLGAGIIVATTSVLSLAIIRLKSKGRGKSRVLDVERIKTKLAALDEDEERTLRIICSNNGRIKQKDLPELTGFSKAKVSRVLNSLSEKGFVSRIQQGRTYVLKVPDGIANYLGGS